MTGQPKKRRTYWIADAVTPALRDRALRLNQKGYDVQFFTSIDALVHELQTTRAGVLVVSDDGDGKMTERILLTLIGLPEVQGARMVMVRSSHSERINFLAACANFRDIIPSNIDERLWLTRFIFATAGRPLQYVQPAGQVTLNNISAVSLPARVTRFGERLLRLECRVRPPVGATLNLGGALAAFAGVPTISLTVIETQRSHLLYRFSDAIVAEWSVPAAARERMRAALTLARASDPGPRCRIFIAVQSPELRTAILSRCDDPRFEVATALQKQSIVDEPKFFTPHLVFIEEALCLEEGGERFQQMLANLQDNAAVVVLGHLEHFAELQSRWPNRRLAQFARIPKNLAQSILSRFLPGRPAAGSTQPEGSGDAHILADDPFSMAEVAFAARLHRIHPLAAQIAMPFPVGNFALVRLDSPLVRKMLGRNPYVKLTSTHQDTHPDAPPFIHVADCYLADLDQGESRAMVQSLTRLITDSLARLDPSGSFGGALTGAVGEARTPELGSLRGGSIDPPLQMAAGPKPHLVPPPPSARSPAAASAGPAAAALDLGTTGEPEQADERLIPAHQIADLIKPFAKQVAEDLREAAKDLGHDMAEKVRQRPAGKRRRRGTGSVDVPPKQILLAVVGVSFLVALLWALFAGLAGTMTKSGGGYSDQLQKFSHMTGQ